MGTGGTTPPQPPTTTIMAMTAGEPTPPPQRQGQRDNHDHKGSGHHDQLQGQHRGIVGARPPQWQGQHTTTTTTTTTTTPPSMWQRWRGERWVGSMGWITVGGWRTRYIPPHISFLSFTEPPHQHHHGDNGSGGHHHHHHHQG